MISRYQDDNVLARFFGKASNYTNIPAGLYSEYNVKKGLRNEDGTGVRIGLTRVSDVIGYDRDDSGAVIPCEGDLLYRGYSINDLIENRKGNFGYEETCFLLLFGFLPDQKQFEEFKNDATLALLKATEPKQSVHIYSYELKRRIESDYQLKQYYFQALSNSSWANFGYLVAFEINNDLDEEMARLNNAFGIGIILMQANDSMVLYPAKEKQLDYNTIEKLNNLNPDFCEFIKKLSKVMNASKDYTSDAKNSFEKICDKIFESDEEQEQYCKDNNIPF